jgi:ABC-type sulfate/molybdate transport systems ATPase subunit
MATARLSPNFHSKSKKGRGSRSTVHRVVGRRRYFAYWRAFSRPRRIGEELARVQLEEFSGTFPARLSGGQQQRVAIARALVAQPLALLMDEPLSNLDDDLKDELCGQIVDLHSQLGFTLVYITHSKEEMKRIGTRTILLRDGKAVSA